MFVQVGIEDYCFFLHFVETQDIYEPITDIVANLLNVAYNFAIVEEIAWQFFPLLGIFL